jgi:mannose-6-phosphate isomerase class I
MNASCALQHFCDLHGPQILLCTEGRTYIHDANDNDNEDLKTFYSQYIKSEHPQGKIECKVRLQFLEKINFQFLVMYIII